MTNRRDSAYVDLPPIEKWNPATILPRDGEAVIGLVKFRDYTFPAMVVFYGNDFLHEFRLADEAVYCSHWLEVKVRE